MRFAVMSIVSMALIVGLGLQVALGQDSYNCGGSTLCSGPLITQPQCDEAMRKIDPARRYFTGGAASSTGVCAGRCGLFVGGGSNCDLTGNEMLVAFQELRSRKCAKCGVKTYNDGCQFKIDYVSGC